MSKIKLYIEALYLKILMFVKQPWDMHDSTKEILERKFYDNPLTTWFMFFLPYLVLMISGVNYFTIGFAVLVSFIIMKIEVKKDFYFVMSKLKYDPEFSRDNQ